jgi:hypothetical protein
MIRGQILNNNMIQRIFNALWIFKTAKKTDKSPPLIKHPAESSAVILLDSNNGHEEVKPVRNFSKIRGALE